MDALGPEGQAGMSSAIPSGRLGEPEDVAALAAFLAAAAADYINGADIVIDGGVTAAP